MKKLEVRLVQGPGRERVDVASAVARWRVHAGEAGVGAESTAAVEKAVEGCLSRL